MLQVSENSGVLHHVTLHVTGGLIVALLSVVMTLSQTRVPDHLLPALHPLQARGDGVLGEGPGCLGVNEALVVSVLVGIVMLHDLL